MFNSDVIVIGWLMTCVFLLLCICAQARPFPTRVPLGTLLYGEKVYQTGTRVRASRYGIR